MGGWETVLVVGRLEPQGRLNGRLEAQQDKHGRQDEHAALAHLGLELSARVGRIVHRGNVLGTLLQVYLVVLMDNHVLCIH